MNNLVTSKCGYGPAAKHEFKLICFAGRLGAGAPDSFQDGVTTWIIQVGSTSQRGLTLAFALPFSHLEN